jgi:hypothetical protein
MPKETTSFKVNFEEISWLNKDAAQPTTQQTSLHPNINRKHKPLIFSGWVAITDFTPK